MKKALLLGFVFCCLPLLADDPAASAPPAASAEKAKALELRDQLMAIAHGGDSSPAAWDAVDAKMDTPTPRNSGSRAQTSNNLGLLRKMELGVVKKADPARYQTLLKKLESDPVPQVADMAKALDAQDVFKMANLQAQPSTTLPHAVDGTEIDLAKLRAEGRVGRFLGDLVPALPGGSAECGRGLPEISRPRVRGGGHFTRSGQGRAAWHLQAERHGLAAQYFDGKGWSNTISSGFAINSIPTLWLVGKDGKVVTTQARDDLAGQVEKLLKP